MSGFSVNTNIAALISLRHGAAADRKLDLVRDRVSTGLNVIGAKDDASTFSIAQGVRGDIKAWSAIEQGLSGAQGLLTVTTAAATAISNALGDIKKKFIEYFSTDSDRQPIIEADINAMLANIDVIARSASYNGVNLLTSDDAGTIVPQPADEGVSQSFSHPGGGPSSGPVHALGTTGGTLRVNYDLTSGNGGQLRLIYNGNTVANTGLGGPNAPGTLTFDYPAGAVQDFNLEMTGAAKTLDYTFFLDTPVTTAVVGGFKVLRDIDGAFIDVQNRSMLAADMEFSPALFSSVQTALAQVEAARQEIDNNLGYYGAKLNEIRHAGQAARRFHDALTEGLGSMVDADLNRESAALAAAEVRQSLAVESLALANARPNVVLDLLKPS
jgi:flagellin